jgi:DNA transformation protein and related proteins
MRVIVVVMRARNPFVEFLTEQFQPLGDISARAMFGGYCLYCDGVVFAIVAGNELYLKTDEHNRERFAERGLKAFQPFEARTTTMSYYQAPPDVFEDVDAMKDWVGSSIHAGLRANRSRPLRARKRTAR